MEIEPGAWWIYGHRTVDVFALCNHMAAHLTVMTFLLQRLVEFGLAVLYKVDIFGNNIIHSLGWYYMWKLEPKHAFLSPP